MPAEDKKIESSKKLVMTHSELRYTQKIEIGVLPKGAFICITNVIGTPPESTQSLALLSTKNINQLKKFLNENF